MVNIDEVNWWLVVHINDWLSIEDQSPIAGWLMGNMIASMMISRDGWLMAGG